MPTRSVSSLRTRADGHGVERIEWAELGPAFLREWGRRGGHVDPEHLSVYGKSGSGKSTFIGYVCHARATLQGSHVVYVATKPADATITRFGWPIITDWPPGYGQREVIYWAKAKGIGPAAVAPQRIQVRRLMNALWVKGSNRIVVWDELTYIETDLGLRREIATFYREGRALGITNVAGMQRPAGVSRLAHSESGWTVAFPPKDTDDRDRVAEVLGNRQLYRMVLDDLDRDRREFLMRDDRTGECYISHLAAARSGRTAQPDARVRSAARDRVPLGGGT